MESRLKTPFKLRVRVFNALKLPDKYSSRHLSVVIEFFKEKFKTHEAEKGTTSPVWIEECNFIVSCQEELRHPLQLNVVSKQSGFLQEEAVVGSVSVNLGNLDEYREKKFHQLQKKGKLLDAHLAFDLGIEPLSLEEKASLSVPKPKSLSIPFHLDKKGHKHIETIEGGASGSSVQSALLTPVIASPSTPATAAASSLVPEITGISPNNGPQSGGTKISIRGSNLGTSKEDILVLRVAGVDCLDSLEYVSERKVTCITKAVVGIDEGYIEIKTLSGGEGTSTVCFQFNAAAGTKDAAVEAAVPSDLHGASKKELQDTIAILQKAMKERDDYIVQLRQYIDRVLLKVIEKSPEILEDLGI